MNVDKDLRVGKSLSVVDDAMKCKDACPWYAIRLFTSCQNGVSEALKEYGLECFIPMEYVNVDMEKQSQVKLRPVVHNLLFLKKTRTEHEIRTILSTLPFHLSVIRKERESSHFYEIPAWQMFEFQIMCDPDILTRKFLSEDNAKLKAGIPVVVQYGPLKGMTGKLVRSNKKYFLLKVLPGLGVMLKVSRWCCRPL